MSNGNKDSIECIDHFSFKQHEEINKRQAVFDTKFRKEKTKRELGSVKLKIAKRKKKKLLVRMMTRMKISRRGE